MSSLLRDTGPGQKALNALVQGMFVHFPIICIRLAIPINEGGMPSFNAVFIVKNIVELISCAMDFLEAGSEVGSPNTNFTQPVARLLRVCWLGEAKFPYRLYARHPLPHVSSITERVFQSWL